MKKESAWLPKAPAGPWANASSSEMLPPRSVMSPCLLLSPAMHPLANAFYRRHGSLMKARDVHQVWAVGAPDISGCACIQPLTDGNGHWLTSLFVDPTARNQGLAGRLLSQMRLAVSGSIWLFCRPELADLYHHHGYQIASHLPESLASKLQRYRREKDLIALVNLG